MNIFHVAIFGLLLQSIEGQSLNTLVADKESVVAGLVQRGEAVHRARCSALQSDSCGCSVPACGNSFRSAQGFACNTNFGNGGDMCDGSGLIRSLNASVVRFPSGVSFGNSPLMEFVCATKAMDADFKTAQNSGRLSAWQYIGHSSGSIRIYPGAPQDRSGGRCGKYDARLRPWYVAASSGPKDVVVIIDRSGSMDATNSLVRPQDGSRLDVVKTAVNSLLNTMTQNDFVSIVAFSDTAVTVGASGLLRATPTNILNLQRAMSSVQASGGTEFIPAFNKAFDVLEGAREQTSSCTRVILFLTDGRQNSGTSGLAVSAAVRAGQARLGSREAHVFTYSMSTAADHDIPKALACENKGVWAEIRDGEDPLTDMGQYYQFLASGINSKTVRWTAPYEDSFGMGRMVTAAQPVYDTTTTIPLLIGVVGTDVPMSELERFANADTVIASLISRSSQCPALSPTTCQLQHLRNTRGFTCPNQISCNNDGLNAQTCSQSRVSTVNSLLCQSLNSITLVAGGESFADVACCNKNSDSNDTARIAYISVGAVVGLVVFVIVGVVVFIKLKASRRRDADERHAQRAAPSEPTYSFGQPTHQRPSAPPAGV